MATDFLRVSKVKTWADNWNDVIKLFYKDRYMRKLMCVPDNVEIGPFMKQYFVRGIGVDELVTQESVRIMWSDGEGTDLYNKNVKLKTKVFDIYVKDSVLHTATQNTLQFRFDLIADRMKDLLLRKKHVCHMSFKWVDGYDMYTKSLGYSRYRVIFMYKMTI